MNANTSKETLFQTLWKDYIDFNPHAKKVYDLFMSEGLTVQNDHIALRTFRHEKVGVDVLAKEFESLGYTRQGEYHFEAKKLYAVHLQTNDPSDPKVFISELLLGEFSDSLQKEVSDLITQIPKSWENESPLSCSGRPWDVSHDIYQRLYQESEYAAWTAAFGFRPNHFTVLTNELEKYQDIAELNRFLKEHGFKLNASGGEIKGSPEVFLEQSSTMAEKTKVKFSDGEFEIPACYYEFARRYPTDSGELYQGFVADSADKIFESTNESE
jgi:hypothetical protein